MVPSLLIQKNTHFGAVNVSVSTRMQHPGSRAGGRKAVMVRSKEKNNRKGRENNIEDGTIEHEREKQECGSIGNFPFHVAKGAQRADSKILNYLLQTVQIASAGSV